MQTTTIRIKKSF